MPNKYIKGTPVCFFSDQADMKKVEEAGAWSVRGSHMLIGRGAIDITMEYVPLDSMNFWVQIRGIPPELLSEFSIRKAVERIGEVLKVEWGDSSIPKSFSIPKTLVTVKVWTPLCLGFKLKRKNGEVAWVSFKYEKLSTLCYNYGLIGHDRGNCSSKDGRPRVVWPLD